jgi:hypothetical protein
VFYSAIIAEIRLSAHPKVSRAAQAWQRRPRRSSAFSHSIGHDIAAAHNRKGLGFSGNSGPFS